MAGRIGHITRLAIATGTALKTMVQLVAATNHAIKILEIAIGFDGVSATQEPVLVTLTRQTDAGTMSSLTPVKGDDSVADTLDTTAQHTATSEPTAGDVLKVWKVHPQQQIVIAFGDGIMVGAGDRIGLVVTSPDAHNADVHIEFEE